MSVAAQHSERGTRVRTPIGVNGYSGGEAREIATPSNRLQRRPRGRLWYELKVPELTNDSTDASTVTETFSRRRIGPETLAVALALALLAVAVRVPGIGEPPFEFHPTRQYRSLILSRSFALAEDDASPAANAARHAAQQTRALEPPLVELLAAAAYRLVGGERIWVGRFLSVVSWVAASFFVLSLGRRFGGDFGGISAMAVFLFTPFAVVASRSFQPDPTMVGLAVLSLWWTWRYAEKPSRAGLIAAGLSAGIAALLKPTAWLFTIIPFVALALFEPGQPIRRRVSVASIYTAIAVAVPLLYYVPALFLGSSLADQAQDTFSLLPLATGTFWRGWVALLERLPGFVILVAGLIGLVMTPPGRTRRFLVALWCGYPILGLLFSYHIHTHDYYGLPILIAVSLSISVLAGSIEAIARRAWPERTGTLLLTGILALSVLLAAGSVIARVTAIGGLPIVDEWRRAGEVVNHSTRTVFLARWYGEPLQYHGELSGILWPSSDDMSFAAREGVPPDTAEHRLQQYIADGAEYFVVTDLDDLEEQPDLARMLARFPLVTASEDLLVFDLRGYRSSRQSPDP